MSKFTLLLKVFCVALLTVMIVGEETEVNKGSAIEFQTEMKKILGILINSLYTSRGIFLREIISNGSDALDKIRFLYLTSPKTPKNDAGVEPTMDIRISVDKIKRQFTMTDGGVGMTKEELQKNLGSLGTSGTLNFLDKMKDFKEKEASNFIGQFGVGFYSVFLVSERVRVSSKSDDSSEQWVWESNADGTFFLYKDDRGNTLGRGTEIVMDLKKDADEYLDIDKIKETIHRYSEFIHFPIFLEIQKTEKVPKVKKSEESSGEEDKKESEERSGEEDKKESEEKKEDGEKKKEDDEYEEVVKKEWELINENKPIWTRKPSEITDDEYNKFYKSVTKDYDEPLYYKHFSAEGEVEFKSVLFIPVKAPYNIFDQSTSINNIRLYVRRVFITDDFKDLLPRYLNFIRGVVDSDDLPLHVSREILQENRILKVIKKKLVRKALQMLTEIAKSDEKFAEKKEGEDEDSKKNKEDKEDGDDNSGNKQLKSASYGKFWDEYGKHLRLGMIEDGTNRNKLTKLLRYKSSKSEDKLVSLDEYVKRMPEKQKNIFYLSGESVEKIKQSPVLEDAIKRDIEVLFMIDAIDEYVVGHLPDYANKKLVNLAKEEAKLADDDKKEKKIIAKRNEKYEPLFKWVKDLLGEKVTKVVITKRITSEPLILSSRQHDITARMAHIIKGQALSDKQQSEQQTRRVMEVNHLHPVINEVFKRIKVDAKDKVAEDLMLILFDTANLQNGFDIEDTSTFSKRINRILRTGVDIAPDAPLITEDVTEFEGDDDDKDDDEEDSPSTTGGENGGEKQDDDSNKEEL